MRCNEFLCKPLRRYCKCNPVAMQIFRVTQKAPKCVDPRITNIMQVRSSGFVTT